MAPWASDGEIAGGHDVAVGRDGSVYVVDLEGRRVQKFRPKPSQGQSVPPPPGESPPR